MLFTKDTSKNINERKIENKGIKKDIPGKYYANVIWCKYFNIRQNKFCKKHN